MNPALPKPSPCMQGLGKKEEERGGYNKGRAG